MTITNEMTAVGAVILKNHTFGTPLAEIVNDVYAGMRALEPVAPPTATLPWLNPAPLGVHAQSATLVSKFWNEGFDRPGNVNIWDTYAMYQQLSSDTVLYSILANRGNMGGQKIAIRSDWKVTPHSDKQMIVLLADGVHAVEFYSAVIDHAGRKITASRADKVALDLMQHPPSRGIGIPYHHMMITADEIAAGEIKHALSLRLNRPHCTQAWFPASKVEGTDGCVADGVPEGARFSCVLPQDRVDAWAAGLRAKSAQLEAFGRMVVDALRIYGFFVTDNGGSSGGFDMQHPISWPTVHPMKTYASSSAGATYMRDVLDGLLQQSDFSVCPEIGPRVGS